MSVCLCCIFLFGLSAELTWLYVLSLLKGSDLSSKNCRLAPTSQPKRADSIWSFQFFQSRLVPNMSVVLGILDKSMTRMLHHILPNACHSRLLCRNSVWFLCFFSPAPCCDKTDTYHKSLHLSHIYPQFSTNVTFVFNPFIPSSLIWIVPHNPGLRLI